MIQKTCPKLRIGRTEFKTSHYGEIGRHAMSLLANSQLEGCNINDQAEDSMHWRTPSNGIYSVKAYYAQMISYSEITESWPWKQIWNTKLPPKIKCFSWTALYQACLTQNNLNKRSIQTVNGCMQQNESNSHILLHFRVAGDIWSKLLTILGSHGSCLSAPTVLTKAGVCGKLILPSRKFVTQFQPAFSGLSGLKRIADV